MQHSKPSANSSSVPFPYCLSPQLARAYARAREANPAAMPSTSDIFGAFAQGPQAGPTPGDAGAPTDPCTGAGYFDCAELLSVLRAPIAWVFTLAERRAESDPVDVAAVHRVRDAALHRVDAIIGGAAPADAPRLRSADLLTVGTLLVGTLDPAIIQRAIHLAVGGITEALSAVLPLIPTFSEEFTGASHAATPPQASGPVASSWFDDLAHAAALFTSPHAGPHGGAPCSRVAPSSYFGVYMPRTAMPLVNPYGGTPAGLHAIPWSALRSLFAF